jgi:hypothetical protein
MSDKKVVPQAITVLRTLGAKPHSVQYGADTYHFKKDTYAIQKALAEEIRLIREPLGVSPDEPEDKADKLAELRYLDAVDDYQLRSNEVSVKIAATVMFRKQTDKNGNLLYADSSVEDIEANLTVTDAQRFMLAYGAFQANLNKVPDAVARFQGG